MVPIESAPGVFEPRPEMIPEKPVDIVRTTVYDYDPAKVPAGRLPVKKLSSPSVVRGTAVMLNTISSSFVRGKSHAAFNKDPVGVVARAIALKGMILYRGHKDGKTVAVVDGELLSKKMDKLRADPAVAKLAEKLSDPKFRESLAAEKNPEGAVVPVSGAKLMENICSQYGVLSKELQEQQKAQQEQLKAQQEQQKAQPEQQLQAAGGPEL